MIVKAVYRQRFELASKVTALTAAGLFLTSCCCPEPARPTHYDPHLNPREPLYSGTQPWIYTGGNPSAPNGEGGFGGGAEPDPAGRGDGPTTVIPIPGVSPTSPCGANPLPVVGIVQEGFYSCWATSAQMIMEYRRTFATGTDPRQCRQVNQAFWTPGLAPLHCCDTSGTLDTSSATCDQAGYPRFDQWMFSAVQTSPGSSLTLAQIATEIDACRPFCFSWSYNSAGGSASSMGHMLVVVGYDSVTAMLKVLDPGWGHAPIEYWIPYTQYTGSAVAGAYTHDRDYYQIQ